MKYIAILFFIMMNTCKSTDNSSFISEFGNQDKKLEVLECLKDGTCSVKVLENKTLTVKKDGIGKLYPTIIEGNNTVIIYTYKKSNPNNYQDGGQSETLHFELTKDTITTLKDGDLQQIKLLFGKHCFCRDIGGFHPVNEGVFTINSSKKGDFEIKIEFNVPKVGDRQTINIVNLKLE